MTGPLLLGVGGRGTGDGGGAKAQMPQGLVHADVGHEKGQEGHQDEPRRTQPFHDAGDCPHSEGTNQKLLEHGGCGTDQ